MNDTYLTCFKSAVHSLIITGDKHILVGELKIGHKLEDAPKEEKMRR